MQHDSHVFNDSVIRTETRFVSSCCFTFISLCCFFLPFFVSVISSLCLRSQPAHLHVAHPLTNQMRSWCQQQLAAFDFAAPQWPDPGLVHCYCVHAGVRTTHLLLRLEDFLCSDEGTNSAAFFECLWCDVFHAHCVRRRITQVHGWISSSRVQ